MIEMKNEHSSFKFEIIGYQFPDYSNEYDGNWLMIVTGRVKTGHPGAGQNGPLF
jgi:hypothetical protein